MPPGRRALVGRERDSCEARQRQAVTARREPQTESPNTCTTRGHRHPRSRLLQFHAHVCVLLPSPGLRLARLDGTAPGSASCDGTGTDTDPGTGGTATCPPVTIITRRASTARRSAAQYGALPFFDSLSWRVSSQRIDRPSITQSCNADRAASASATVS